jgi:neutral trehalase
MTEWKARGLHRAKHVRVYLWRDEEGAQGDADAIVEMRPKIYAELHDGWPGALGSLLVSGRSAKAVGHSAQ